MKRPLLLLLCLFSLHIAFSQRVKKLRSLPDYYVYDSQGDSVNIRELAKGKVAFVNFWFIPCAPCFMEMQSLSAIYDRFRSDTNFIFISVCRSNTASVARLLRQDHSDTSLHNFMHYAGLETLPFPIYSTIACSDDVRGFGNSFRISYQKSDSGCGEEAMGIAGYPTNMIADRTGKLLMRNTGFAPTEKGARKTEEAYIKAIESALK